MAKLVYIGGYGHSGSTLLEYLMTAHPQVIACGEVVNLCHVEAKTKECSCGKLAKECSVWSILAQWPRPNRRRHEDLDLALLQHVSRKHAIMVDSSKTAWRHAIGPFRLRHRLRRNFLLVHIVRDPRAVCWSLFERGRRMGRPQSPRCIKVGLGWLYANLVCELFRWIYPKQYHRVRYEDLVRSSHEVMPELLQKVLPAAEWRFEQLGTNDNRHQLFGNRMRRSRRLSLGDIREDDAWQTSMPMGHRRLVRNLCWALSKRYDYQ